MNKDQKIEKKKKLVFEIQKLAKKLGKTPTALQIAEAHVCCLPTVYVHFGSIVNFQKEAGLEPHYVGRPVNVVTKKDCIDELKRITIKLKRFPRREDITVHSRISLLKIIEVVGSTKDFAEIRELRRALGHVLIAA